MAKYASVLFKSLFATLIEGRIEKKLKRRDGSSSTVVLPVAKLLENIFPGWEMNAEERVSQEAANEMSSQLHSSANHFILGTSKPKLAT